LPWTKANIRSHKCIFSWYVVRLSNWSLSFLTGLPCNLSTILVILFHSHNISLQLNVCVLATTVQVISSIVLRGQHFSHCVLFLMLWTNIVICEFIYLYTVKQFLLILTS
jgi:hypothetical protein